MFYDTSIGNDFKATYAYDEVTSYKRMPYCSDLMVRFYADAHKREGKIGIEMSKYGTVYRAGVDLTGKMVIERVKGSWVEELVSESIAPPTTDKPILVKFANVDHRLIFEFGKKKLTHDLGDEPDDAGERRIHIEPKVKILGSGQFTLSHVAIFRDIHYITHQHGNSGEYARGAEGKAFKLGKGEYFVLGDNSPNSLDSRWWNKPGLGNNGREYTVGIVPQDYLVGKALFVYWPSGFKPFAKFPLAIIPNVGGMRFIHGGSSNNL